MAPGWVVAMDGAGRLAVVTGWMAIRAGGGMAGECPGDAGAR